MFDVPALAEPILLRVTHQYTLLTHALQWPPSDSPQLLDRPLTPLHADLAVLVAIANGELDRTAVDDQTLGDILDRFQRLLDLLFKPVSGYYGYSIPPNFWATTPLGQMLARVQAWLRHDDLLTYTDAAHLLYPEHAASNLQAARMRVQRLVTRGLLQGYTDPHAPNPTQHRRVSRQAAEALLATGQHLPPAHLHRNRAEPAHKYTASDR